MTADQLRRVEAFLAELTRDMSDEEFVEVLEEVAEHARGAADVRREDMDEDEAPGGQ